MLLESSESSLTVLHCDRSMGDTLEKYVYFARLAPPRPLKKLAWVGIMSDFSPAAYVSFWGLRLVAFCPGSEGGKLDQLNFLSRFRSWEGISCSFASSTILLL